jgi:uncharacterized protein YndB with AHSA1/START domain
VPRARRTRLIAAKRPELWRVVSDPYQLPRWWPKVVRVEGVQERRHGTGTLWTKVLRTSAGRDLRADYRCLRSAEPSDYFWEQEVEGSPFAKVFKSAQTAIVLDEEGEEATRVTITVEQKLRGMSRTGGFMIRRATGTQLDEALESLAGLFEGAPEGRGEAPDSRAPRTRDLGGVSSEPDSPAPEPEPPSPESEPASPERQRKRELDA